jgi:hypothetical protein
MLTVVCHIRKMRHRAWDYFKTRLAYLVAAFNIFVQWDCLKPNEQGGIPFSIARSLSNKWRHWLTKSRVIPKFRKITSALNVCIYLLQPRQKLPPFLLDVSVVEDIVWVWAWRGRLGEQFHVGFTRCVARFAMVAWSTGADHILPYVRTLARTGNYVVECQVLRFGAAVLAAEAVAVEYGSPRKSPSNQWPLDHVDKPNHGRNGHTM